MASTPFDSRQTEHRSNLPRLSDQAKPTLKQVLPQIDAELTPVFELRESSTPDLVLNVGANKITNSDTGLTRAMSPIGQQFFDFTSGTVTFPASSGGAITVSPGTNGVLTVTSGNFIAVLVQIDSQGDLSVVTGTEAASAALAVSAANFPVGNAAALPIGYVVMENSGGTIQNVTNESIVQFESGGGSGGGSGSEINYIENGDAEVGIAGWETYADTADTKPANASGGSPTTTFTQNTTTPLRDNADFKLTKDAANRQGEGAAYPFEIENADIARILSISFDYDTSDANYADDDIAVYIVCDDTGDVIEPVGKDLKAGKSTHLCTFQTDASSTNYRLAFHVASTNATAYDIYFDRIRVGPVNLASAFYGTDAESIDITSTWDASATHEAVAWREGEFLNLIIATTLNAAAPAAVLEYTLPYGLSINSDKSVGVDGSGNTSGMTYSYLKDVSTPANNVSAKQYIASTTAVGLIPEGVFTVVNQTTPFTWASGDIVFASYKLPIQGWSSNRKISESISGRETHASAYRSTDQSIPNNTVTTIIHDTVNDDFTGIYDNTTGEATITESGVYFLMLQTRFTANGTGSRSMAVRVNGTEKVRNSAPGSAVVASIVTIARAYYLKAGDVIDSTVFQNSGGALNLNGGDNATWIGIYRVGAGQSPSSSELVSAKYTTDSGQAIPNNTVTIVNFEDKLKDSHSAVTVGASWQYRVPFSGDYYVDAMATLQNIALDIGEVVSGLLYVNNVLVYEQYATEAEATNTNLISAVASALLENLQAGDTIDFRLYQNSGASYNLNTNQTRNHFSIFRVK